MAPYEWRKLFFSVSSRFHNSGSGSGVQRLHKVLGWVKTSIVCPGLNGDLQAMCQYNQGPGHSAVLPLGDRGILLKRRHTMLEERFYVQRTGIVKMAERLRWSWRLGEPRQLG